MSLYELERDGDAQALIRVLRESDNPRVRARAAEFLGTLEDHQDRRDVVNALVEAAQSADDAVAAIAVDALDALGQDAIESLVSAMADVDFTEAGDGAKERAFAEALSADSPELRMAAATGLGRLGSTDAVESLTETFDDPDPRVRARAARACGEIDDPRATDPLEGLLHDDVADVRREAAEALGALASRQALEALLDLYEDDDERVRRIAVGAFGNFDNDRPVPYLVAALTDDVVAVRRTAVFSLVELLANVPTERSHDVRETIVDRLSATDDRNVVVPLVEIIEETTEAPQRRNTAWLLGRIAGGAERDRVIEALIDALHDDDEMVRQFAATSLAELDDGDVEDHLLPLVTDESVTTEVRAQATFVLGTVGGERSRSGLDALIDETDDEFLRKRAYSAISKLGGRR